MVEVLAVIEGIEPKGYRLSHSVYARPESRFTCALDDLRPDSDGFDEKIRNITLALFCRRIVEIRRDDLITLFVHNVDGRLEFEHRAGSTVRSGWIHGIEYIADMIIRNFYGRSRG